MTATEQVSARDPTSSGHGGQEMGDHAWVESERVLGVDACKAGWVGLALTGLYCGANVAGTIDELVEMADADGPLAVVAVDIPIGLPNRGRRQADVLARKAVGTLTSSVFMTPTRAALDAPDHPTASARNHALTGKGISRQAFSLKPKLHQVERWVRQTHHHVVEVHPEVSFAELADAPLTVSKSTWAGAEYRRQLLADAGVLLAGDLGEAGRRVAVDDVLDAAVAAWTARRVLDRPSPSTTEPTRSVQRRTTVRDLELTQPPTPHRPTRNVATRHESAFDAVR
jgi:predicted RNase H-like nuclease